MTFKKNITFLCALLLAVASCKKGTPANTEKSGPKPVLTAGPGIYVVGSVIAANGLPVATCWKNGIATKLADSTSPSTAYSILITGSDIYISGLSENPGYGNEVTTYWKNGVVTRVSAGSISRFQSSLTLNGNDVFVSGFLAAANGDLATYWKNGAATSLPDNSAGSIINGIALNGSDIYVAGILGNHNAPLSAAYWKNGILTKLTDSSLFAEVNAISIYGNDVYLAGDIASARFYYKQNGRIENPVATYWKNGLVTKVGDSTAYSKAFSILPNGKDLFIAGVIMGGGVYSPAYWKNGIPTKLDASALTDNSGLETAALALNGTDIYVVAGYSGYWKNGVAMQLGKTSSAFGITVVPN